MNFFTAFLLLSAHFFFFGWILCSIQQDLVPRNQIQSMPPALMARSSTNQITRKVPWCMVWRHELHAFSYYKGKKLTQSPIREFLNERVANSVTEAKTASLKFHLAILLLSLVRALLVGVLDGTKSQKEADGERSGRTGKFCILESQLERSEHLRRQGELFSICNTPCIRIKNNSCLLFKK